MRAIVIHETGGLDVLHLEDMATPVPGPGEVLVRTEAIGVNFTDVRWRAGGLLPMSPVRLPAVVGFEAAGSIVGVGDDVDRRRIGERVAIVGGSGTYAEYVATPAQAAIRLPEGLTANDAVSVAVSGAVALALLRSAGLTGTETVLIEAAGGGIGGYLVQLAHELGARRVIATAGSAEKRDMARDLGADTVVDHRSADWTDAVRHTAKGEGIDVIFESIGGASAGRLLDSLVPGRGRMLFYGLLSGEPPAIEPMDLLLRGVGLIGCGGRPSDYASGEAVNWSDQVESARGDLLERAANGRVHPIIDSVIPLADAARAHQRVEDRRAAGKVILLP